MSEAVDEAPKDACPDRARWQAWLRDELDPETFERFNLHLETCRDCPAMVESIAGSPEGDLDPDSVSRLIRQVFHDLPRDGAQGPRQGAAGLPPPASEATQRVGKFVLLNQVGWGGFGVVYRAFDVELKRVVALKLALPGKLDDEEARWRLLLEARASSGLIHPGIVETLEAGEVDGRAFIASAFCAGGSLEAWLRELGPSPIRLAAAVVAALADAAEHAHAKGVLHLDIKAANVLIDPADGEWAATELGGRPRLADFGLARQLEATARATGSTTSRAGRDGGGTISAMAREQARGEEVFPSTDVYSLGALLYRMIAGQHALKGANLADTIRMILDDEPSPLRRLRLETPRDLEAIAMKCLAKAPGDRYRTAGELADDLRRFLDGRPVTARHPGPIALAWRWARRHPTLSATTALALVALIAFASNLVLSNRRYAALNRALALRNYASEVNRSFLAWQAGDAALGREILDSLAPGRPEDEDPRGFEWRLLRRLVAPDVADRTIRAHTAAAVGVAFSHDDSKLISCGLDGQVKLWDARDGRLLRTFAGHVGDVNKVIFVGNFGAEAASAGDDGTVRVWDLEQQAEGRTLRGPGGKLYHLAAPAYGHIVVAGGVGSGLIVWESKSGRQVAHLRPGSTIAGLTISPDGGYIVAALADPPRVEFWAIPRYASIANHWPEVAARTIQVAGHPFLENVVIGPDQTIAAGSGDRSVRLIRGQDGSSIPPWTGLRDVPECLAIAPDGRTLAVGTRDGEVRVSPLGQATAPGPGELVFQQGAGRVYGLAFASDGWSLASAFADGTIRILSRVRLSDRASAMTSARMIGATPEGKPALSIRHDGARLALSSARGSHLELTIDPWSLADTEPLDRSSSANHVEYSPDGTFIAADDGERDVRLWEGKHLIARWRVDGVQCRALKFAPDGRSLLTIGAEGGLRRWSIPGGKPLGGFPDGLGRSWLDLAIAPDGRSVAAVGKEGDPAIFDMASGRLLARRRDHGGECEAIAFAPDGSTFATGGRDRTIMIHDPATARPVREMKAHSEWIRSIAYSPDGRTLASGDEGGALALWQVSTGALLAQFHHPHRGKVSNLAFTPDGSSLISVVLPTTSVGLLYTWESRDRP